MATALLPASGLTSGACRCDKVRPWRHGEGEDEGYEFRIFFDLKQRLGEGQQGTGTMWACCLQHKKLAIKEIIRDIHMGRHVPQPSGATAPPAWPHMASDGAGGEGGAMDALAAGAAAVRAANAAATAA